MLMTTRLRSLGSVFLVTAWLAAVPWALAQGGAPSEAGPRRERADASSSPAPAATPLASPLSLLEALRVAAERNPQITAAEQRAAAQEELLGKSRGARALNLRLTAEALRYGELPSSKKSLIGPGDNDILFGVGTSQLLFSELINGQVDAATANAWSALQQSRRTRQEVAYQVVATYYEVQRALKRRELDEQMVAQMEAHLDLARGLFQTGKVAELDVLRAEVQLADGRQRLITSGNAVDISYQRLRNALGLEDAAPLQVEALTSPLLPRWQPSECEDDLLGRAYAQRPEMQAAQAQVARFQAERRQAAAGLKPQVQAVGNYYREGTSLSLDYDNWYVGLSISLPLADGQATRHAVKASEALIKAAEADLQAVQQTVRLEVRDAWLSIREAAERLVAMEAAIRQAQQALGIEEQGYKLGMNTMLDVLDTQTALMDAQYNYLDACFAYQSSQARLREATGEDELIASASPPGGE